ncbi:MAG: hypothetical protein KAS78_03780 [Candidatus Pacebacteria bacterium]|nr:hypothetical protein [Candidatus Paceibacterota bacterium]
MEKEQHYNFNEEREEFLEREIGLMIKALITEHSKEDEKYGLKMPSKEDMRSELEWKIKHFSKRFSSEERVEMIKDNYNEIKEAEEKLKNATGYDLVKIEELIEDLNYTNRIIQGIQDGKI